MTAMTAMTMRARACEAARARAREVSACEGRDKRKVGRGARRVCARARVRSVAAAGRRVPRGGRPDGGAGGGGGGREKGVAACAHRRALHSACTSERCG